MDLPVSGFGLVAGKDVALFIINFFYYLAITDIWWLRFQFREYTLLVLFYFVNFISKSTWVRACIGVYIKHPQHRFVASILLAWGQCLPFCKEINFVTKYITTKPNHVMCELSRLCYWNTRVNFHVIWCIATLGLQNRNKVVRRPKSKHKSKLVLSKVKSTTAVF